MSEESKEVAEWVFMLEQMPGQAKLALAAAEDTSELVDVVGTLHMVASQLGVIKRRAAAEIESGDSGRRWMLTQGRKAKRTYNTMSLIMKFQQKWKDKSAAITIMRLVEEDALRINWQWKNLTNLASDYGIPITRISDVEVESGSEFDVGEEWVNDSPSYERVDE